MITRLRNGYLAKKLQIIVTNSKLIQNVLKVLEKEGYIKQFSEINSDSSIIKYLKVDLKYNNNIGAIRKIKTISRPGKKQYSKCNDNLFHKDKLGVVLISTPKGIKTGYEAYVEKLGGLLLLEVF